MKVKDIVRIKLKINMVNSKYKDIRFWRSISGEDKTTVVGSRRKKPMRSFGNFREKELKKYEPM